MLPKESRSTETLIRLMKQLRVIAFGQHTSNYPWIEAFHEQEVNNKLRNFHIFLDLLTDHYFPTKTVNINLNGQPWITLYIKDFIIQRL